MPDSYLFSPDDLNGTSGLTYGRAKMSIKSIRPSNLVLLAAAPFIIYLFWSSSKYSRSLKAIVGVEDNALALLTGFLILSALLVSGLICTRAYFKSKILGDIIVRIEPYSIIALPVILLLIFLWPTSVLPFVHSVVAHSVDPFNSTWIVPTVRPRQLTPEIQLVIDWYFNCGLIAYGILYLGLLAARAMPGFKLSGHIVRLAEISSTLMLFHLFFLAHWGFGTGIAVTLRATIFAYILAALLGLFWTGLQSLRIKKNTILLYGAVGLLFILISTYFGFQPTVRYLLVGSTNARIAIIKGTPQNISDIVRFGDYEGAESTNVKIRSVPDVESALKSIRESEQVSGALIPAEFDNGEFAVLTEISFLPSRFKVPSLIFLVAGALLLILTFGAYQHRMHPMAIASEFFVDTIRGIPMLVIILYVGLPLSGAIKDATDGGIDLSNMARGIVAIAIGYSAYMAEIFRAGIESIPKGQLEAGSSLGLTGWQKVRFIILPQALRVVTPPLGNEFIAMIKDTSLLSILSVRDVTQRMREFQAASFLPFAPFNTAAILYVVITLACASLLKWIERRYEYRKN